MNKKKRSAGSSCNKCVAHMLEELRKTYYENLGREIKKGMAQARAKKVMSH